MITPSGLRKIRGPRSAISGILGAVCFAVMLTCDMSVACASDASAWNEGTHSAARLLAGRRDGDTFTGGIEIRLAPNWKTYWRTPGDSGVPPRLDFSTSDNVETVTVLWPAPEAFDDGGGGQSIGYKQHVVLPLRIVPKNAAKPVILRAQIDYAICEKLCIPVDASLELQLDQSAIANDALLTEALAIVPKPSSLGEPPTLTVRSVHRDETGQRVLVDVQASESDHPRLFVEGPTPDWALPIPSRMPGSSQGSIRYSFALDGLPPGGEAKGAELKLTLVGDHEAHEFAIRLD